MSQRLRHRHACVHACVRITYSPAIAVAELCSIDETDDACTLHPAPCVAETDEDDVCRAEGAGWRVEGAVEAAWAMSGSSRRSYSAITKRRELH